MGCIERLYRIFFAYCLMTLPVAGLEIRIPSAALKIVSSWMWSSLTELWGFPTESTSFFNIFRLSESTRKIEQGCFVGLWYFTCTMYFYFGISTANLYSLLWQWISRTEIYANGFMMSCLTWCTLCSLASSIRKFYLLNCPLCIDKLNGKVRENSMTMNSHEILLFIFENS